MLPRGDLLAYHAMMLKVEELKDAFIAEHPEVVGREGFRFEGSDLVLASDGTPRPAYDVKIRWSHLTTPEEQALQAEERKVWLLHREEEYRKREIEQKALLEAVLADIEAQSRHR